MKLIQLLAAAVAVAVLSRTASSAIERTFYVLPHGDSTAVYIWVNDSLQPVAYMAWPPKSFASENYHGPETARSHDSLRFICRVSRMLAYDPISGWIAEPRPSDHSIDFIRYRTDSGLSHRRLVPFIGDLRLFGIAFADSVLYAGGTSGRESLGLINPGAETPTWTPVPIDSQLMQVGKAVDGFVLRDTTLIAVDDIVYPKYLLVYDVSDPLRPVYTIKHELIAHGIYEHVWHIAAGGSYFALLSSAGGRGSSAQHVAIHDLQSLREVGCITNHKQSSRIEGYTELLADTLTTWEHVSLAYDILFIAAGPKGIGHIACRTITGATIDSTQLYATRMRLSQAIRYTVPDAVAGASVLRVDPIPEHRVAVVTVARDNHLETVTIPLSEILR